MAHQAKGDIIEGNKLRQELKGQLFLNACVLNYLLVHSEFIPDQWKGKAILFWGTIYRKSDINFIGSAWRGTRLISHL